MLVAMFVAKWHVSPLTSARGLLGGVLLGVFACGGRSRSPEPLPAETPPTEISPTDMSPPSGPEGDPADEVPSPPALVQSVLAEAFALFVEDALAQPEEARPYLRYVLSSRGVAEPESEQERLALLRLVNSVSLSPQIAAPVPLAELGAYRLDLRDYLWNRPVDVGGVTFSDGWEAIVERSGLALPRLPDERLAQLTGTTTALLPARAFLTATSNGAVYYALTSVPDFEVELQERLAARFPDPDTERVYNTGFGQEVRHSYQGARRLLLPDGSAYWQGLPDTARGNSLYADPLSFNSWETDAIYPLPNGFPAFFVDTPYFATSPAPLTQLRGRVENTADEVVADCIACHAYGPLPAEDFLGDFVRNNVASYDVDTAQYAEEWPSQEELDAIVAADSAVYGSVLERAGLSAESAGALQSITRRYAEGLGFADMAAALHATETQVRAVLPAGATTFDAESFKFQFRALICQIHPDAAAASGYCS